MKNMDDVTDVFIGLVSPIHALCIVEGCADKYSAALVSAISRFNNQFCSDNNLTVDIRPPR